MNNADIGLIGLGTMGKNLAMNIADRGFTVIGYNRSSEVTKQIVEENHENFYGALSIGEMVNALSLPRKIIIMVSAGNAVDQVLEQLLPYLDKGDIIMDGGNSFFEDTIRRHDELANKCIVYYGVGISGGEEGARHGASIMPGGDKQSYQFVQPILEAIAAKKDNDDCCTYIGPNGSGHYVKMVHNGIEYADMQLLAEVYLLLKNIGHFSNEQMSRIFNDWNQTECKSYLVEITSKVLSEKDDLTENDLIDMIKDNASQKGTGKWTSLEAIKQDQNNSLITTAFQARLTSNLKEREILQKKISPPLIKEINPEIFMQEVKKAYYLAKIIAYAQGFALYEDASKRYHWNLDLEGIASIFRAGCIIQANLLEDIMMVYKNDKELTNLLLSSHFINIVNENIQSLRVVLSLGIFSGIPMPVLTNAISYLDQLRSQCVGANLIQGQRDYFGAHTFKRIDKDGNFHHDWEN